jgi:hypothetical protein
MKIALASVRLLKRCWVNSLENIAPADERHPWESPFASGFPPPSIGGCARQISCLNTIDFA